MQCFFFSDFGIETAQDILSEHSTGFTGSEGPPVLVMEKPFFSVTKTTTFRYGGAMAHLRNRWSSQRTKPPFILGIVQIAMLVITRGYVPNWTPVKELASCVHKEDDGHQSFPLGRWFAKKTVEGEDSQESLSNRKVQATGSMFNPKLRN